MKRSQISLKNKIKSYALSFDTKEFLESVDDNVNNCASSVMGKERRAWFNGSCPGVVDEIDKQLRSYFDIKEESKLIFSLYYPPKSIDGKFIDKETKIANKKDNIFNRIFVCTVPEQVEITMGKSIGEKMLLKSWEAYQSPPLVGGMLDYIFENKKHMHLEARKGFRSTRRSKKIDDRYIMVFDYLVSNNDMEKLGQILKQTPSH